MTRAEYGEKNLIVEILSKSFDTNQSVNYIVKQDRKKAERLKALMDYSFEVCYAFGEIFLSDGKEGCALVLFPDKKRTTIKSIFLDAKLIISCVGIGNIKKAMSRESKIKNIQSKDLMYYLWFIGVDPQYQTTGIGTELMNGIIETSRIKKRPIYLETSTLTNLPWYKKFDFTIYSELDLGYKLFFLKREMNL